MQQIQQEPGSRHTHFDTAYVQQMSPLQMRKVTGTKDRQNELPQSLEAYLFHLLHGLDRLVHQLSVILHRLVPLSLHLKRGVLKSARGTLDCVRVSKRLNSMCALAEQACAQVQVYKTAAKEHAYLC